MNEPEIDYKYADQLPFHTHAYLWHPVLKEIKQQIGKSRIFDLGCGNGSFARWLKEKGYDITGVDPSEEGIAQSKLADPELKIEVGSAYDPLHERFGTFPVVVSLEVVEHVYFPRKYAECVRNLLEPGGVAIVSTPYHSYFKNIVLAVSGNMDKHFTALWEHGHIKFWSIKTLTELFSEQGMMVEKVLRVGRIPILGKSMILVIRKNA